MEKSKFRILSNFGWSVREVVRKKLGPPSKTKPRAPGKPPRTRTNDKAVTLRNLQYAYKPGQWTKRLPKNSRFDEASAGVPIFARTKRYGGRSIPEVQEFGGSIRTGIMRTVERTATGRLKKRNGKPIEKVSYSSNYPTKVILKIPARPYLAPSLKPAINKTKRRMRSQGVL